MDRKRISVFITSCELVEGAWRAHEQKLKELYELSSKKYTLASDPASADIILVGNVREENWGKKTLCHELINKYPNKCFSLSDQDLPLILNRGIYASGVKSILNLGRVCTGSFTIYGDHHLNPFIQNHVFSNQKYLKKEYLFNFIGRNSHKVRNSLFDLKFERSDVYIEDSSKSFDLWAKKECGGKVDRQKYYYDMLLRSKFSLCPRGGGASSIRIFESMMMGIAPIIISDDWILPNGPRWNEFSIFIKEKNIRDLEKIVEDQSANYLEMGNSARKAFEEYFAENVYFDYVVDNCLGIMRKQLIPELIYWNLNPLIIFIIKSKIKLLEKSGRLRGKVKNLLGIRKLIQFG